MYENLCQENAGLVHFFAKRYRMQMEPDYEDIVQAGYIGLINAAQSFDHKAGGWSSWAGLHIRHEMRQALGLNTRQKQMTISLDAPLADGEDTTMGEMIADDSLLDIDAGILQSETARAVRKAIEAIDNKTERAAIKGVYIEGLTVAEAARRLEVRENELSNLLRRGKTKLRNDRKLIKAVRELDEETSFYRHKSIAAFTRDRSSIVEDAVIWRAKKLAEIV